MVTKEWNPTKPAPHTIGDSVPRIDAHEKVTGAAIYTDDYQFGPGLLYARIKRSPHPHAHVPPVLYSAQLTPTFQWSLSMTGPYNYLDEIYQDCTREQIEYKTDLPTRLLYSTDASIYQIEPLGVVFPRSGDELSAAVTLAVRYGIPILARGSGSSLAGQAIGAALILDCSRYLNSILDINPEERTATVEPGVILNSLNRQAARHQLQFGPDGHLYIGLGDGGSGGTDERSKLVKKGKRVYVIPAGGSSTLGIWGYISFMNELKKQIDLKNIYGIFSACGSGGTTAGLLVGAALNKTKVKIFAVNVLLHKETIRKKILQLAEGPILDFKLPCNIGKSQLEIIDGYSKEGYKNISDDKIKLITEFARSTGMLLDPAYTGKAFSAYNDLVLKKGKGKKVIFLHTGGIFGRFPKRKEFVQFS